MTIHRIETKGSYFEIDDSLMRYRRWPKEEKPRENGWGGPDQGNLQDAVWHDYLRWMIKGCYRVNAMMHLDPDVPMYEIWYELMIGYEHDPETDIYQCVKAPMPDGWTPGTAGLI